MKKFLSVMILLMMICVPASATRLEMIPQPIGKILCDNSYNLQITLGSHKIDISKKTREDNFEGVMTFDQDFYFHFDTSKKNSYFGDQSFTNTVKISVIDSNEFMVSRTEIFRVENTAGLPFYVIRKTSASGDSAKVLGKLDGKWVECLDTLDFQRKFGIGSNGTLNEIFTQDNKIIFRYKLHNQIIDVECHWHVDDKKFYPEAIKH